MDKIAFTVLHGNITNNNINSVGNNEAWHIADLMRKYYDVDFLTCKECDGCISVDEEYDINQYKYLFVVNGSLNMFGGLEIETATTVYKLMHKFNNQIFYVLTDLTLPFIDYYHHIEKKKFNIYDRDAFSLQRPLVILSQFKDLDKVVKMHKGIDCTAYYIPFAYWYASYVDDDQKKLFSPGLFDEKIDLIYGGSFRSGRRQKKMEEYFFNHSDINVELYGNIKRSQFDGTYTSEPKFGSKVGPKEVIGKNSSALATVIIGDGNYNDNTITLRAIEALASDCLMFIDHDFDPRHEILSGIDYLYVHSGKELENKIKEIKNNPSLYNDLKQRSNFIFDEIKKYDLAKNVKEIIEKI